MDKTNEQITENLLAGRWEVLNEVLNDAANLNIEREQAIRNIHYGCIYIAGYYSDDARNKIINSVTEWDKHVGFVEDSP